MCYADVHGFTHELIYDWVDIVFICIQIYIYREREDRERERESERDREIDLFLIGKCWSETIRHAPEFVLIVPNTSGTLLGHFWKKSNVLCVFVLGQTHKHI